MSTTLDIAAPSATTSAATSAAPSAGMPAGTRERLRNQVFFRATEQGVHFDAGAMAFELKGRGIFPLVQRVLALMDAGHALPAIRAGLPASLQAWFDGFVDTLRTHRMLIDDSSDEAWLAQLTAGERVREFLKYLQDQLPAEGRRERLAQWRQAHAVLRGQGYALKAAAQALLATGIGRISLQLEGAASRVGAEELQHMAAAWPDTSTVIAPAGLLAPAAGLLLHVSDAELDAVGEAALQGQLAALDGDAIAAVAVRLRGHTLAWSEAAAPQTLLADLLDTLEPRADAAPSPAALAIAGSVAAQSLLRRHFSIGDAALRHRVFAVSDHLELQAHALVPAAATLVDWAAGPEGAAAAEPATPAAATDPLRADEALRLALAPWFDPLSGAFATVENEALVQLPLYHETCRLRARSAEALVAWGLDANEAWRRALGQVLVQRAAEAQPQHANRLVCAFDEAEWRRQALALALLDSSHWQAGARSAEAPLLPTGDGPADLLQRLLCFLTDRPLTVRVQWHPGFAAARLWIRAGHEWLAESAAATPLLALREALGSACSRLQTGAEGTLVVDTAVTEAVLPPWSHGEALTPPPARWQRLSWRGLPERVVLGLVELESQA
ncbi:hypothetical protein LNV23_20055 [Paucibacter sp. DJ1R-11]|uniref:hypothetical protein n=1 Tax=Paucibacter sp. DJ1R-11 TaxID=2893556 RepID=UPI0021E4C400|nr:hypothetical protein [Paucibacter sp. DJ1R-11]MCV2365748.1 hypothetical protein [Paucibacter sp. DJ1R-11]